MSVLTKKTHVHFNDDAAIDSTLNKDLDDNGGPPKPIIESKTVHYSRDKLLSLRNSNAAQKPPKIADGDKEIQMNERRMERIKFVLKKMMESKKHNLQHFKSIV